MASYLPSRKFIHYVFFLQDIWTRQARGILGICSGLEFLPVPVVGRLSAVFRCISSSLSAAHGLYVAGFHGRCRGRCSAVWRSVVEHRRDASLMYHWDCLITLAVHQLLPRILAADAADDARWRQFSRGLPHQQPQHHAVWCISPPLRSRSPPRAGGLFAFFCILLRLYFMLITHRNFPSRAADKLLFISAEWS